MFTSVQTKRDRAVSAVVDITPMIDIVFILLVFFLVTATFVRDTGVRVQRPQAVSQRILEPTAMRVSIAPSGTVYTEGRQVTLEQLSDRVRAFVQAERHRSVIVIPDQTVPSGRLVEVLDTARLAGAQDVAIATRDPHGP